MGGSPPARATDCKNVCLKVGVFSESLPGFVAQCKAHDSLVPLIHVDCDLYSSTQCIFQGLQEILRQQKSTIVVFDEAFNYGGFERHELFAFFEFLYEQKFNHRWIGIEKGGHNGRCS